MKSVSGKPPKGDSGHRKPLASSGYEDLLDDLPPDEAASIMVDVRARLNLGERQKRILLIVRRINPLEDLSAPEIEILHGIGRDKRKKMKERGEI